MKVLIDFDESYLERDLADLQSSLSDIDDVLYDVKDILDKNITKKIQGLKNAINDITPYLELLSDAEEFEVKE